MKFMLMGFEVKGEWERLPQSERDRRVEGHQHAIQALIAERGVAGGGNLSLTSVGLGPVSDATTIRITGGKPLVVDGPFAETKEALAGFDVIDFESRDAAIAFAKKRCSHDGHVTEIRPLHNVRWAYHGPGKADAMKFMLMFIGDERSMAKLPAQEIERWVTHHQQVAWEYIAQKGMVRRETLAFSGARLRASTDATTLRLRGGKALTSDGPFAETKEVLGGFWLIDCSSKDEAIELARRFAVHGGEGAQWTDYSLIEIRPVQSVWWIYHG